ncbi:hypothetical protein HEP86_13060 [Streptomyces sp. RPA4-5]|uniref:hypothetical protein n=1 Tax=Streptomyces sp. RPA4-5 TaxID=2721245 RepID=UPI001181BE4B|nr:hypothetical protein [Streptomyces sp. RPA4-5]QIY55292.1 hypothetical protein HEP86_13060 [Streptomyces sp. RPA4-5]
MSAVLGALVGALATGGGAYISGRYAAKTQKKQARREVYRVFLSELTSVHMQIAKIRELLFYLNPHGEADPNTIKAELADLKVKVGRLRDLEVGVRLEGPQSVASPANEATRQVSRIEHRLEFAHSRNLQDNDLLRVMEVVEGEYGSLDELVGRVHCEAPKHL